MKKIFSYLLAFVFVLTVMVCPVSAKTAEPTSTIVSETTEYFADGSSVTTTIQEESVNITRALTTKSGSKTKTVLDSDGNVLYKFKVTGTFAIYSNGNCNCTSATRSHTIVVSSWSCKTSEAHTSGASAVATGTFVRKVLGITVETDEISVSLTCDANGNLS